MRSTKIRLCNLLTTVFLLCSYAYANEPDTEDNQCREIVIGETGRKFWVDSVSNGLRGEFVDQIQKKEDLFERLIPELEFEIGPKGKSRVTFTREVQDHLPPPTNGEISYNDFFTLQIKNEIFVDISAGVSGPYLFSNASAGLSLKHLTFRIPEKKSSICDLVNLALDTDVEKGAELTHAFEQACKNKDKLWIERFYEGTIDLMSTGIDWALDYIVDSEKNEVFTEKILDPLKLHTKLGVPIDYKIFFENYQDLYIGDIIEHTSFIGFTPLGVKLDMIELFTPTHSYYGRVFRTVSMKKLYKNKVTIEFEDVLIYGDRTEIYKIKPKLFDLIKVNMGRWAINDYKQESLLQRFDVDLNSPEGVKFFRKVLGSLYIHDLASDKVFNEQLIDATPYGDAVVADDPVFTDSEGKDNVLQFKIPGLLEYKDGSYKKIKNIKYKGREYTKGVKLEQEKLKNKIAFNAGIFEVKRADRDYTCQMQLASDVSVKTKDKSALNIMCKYYDKYGDNKNFDSVKEYLDIFLTGNIPEETQEILKNVEYSEPDVINLSSRLSFSESQIQNILEAKDDEIYSLISYLLFGPKAKNVFAKKYHRQWRQANLKTRDRRDNHKLSTLNSCSELLVQLGITEKKELLYDKFEGLVGKGRGLRDFEHYRCYSYFLLAKNTVKAISKLQVSARSENRLNRFLDIFQDLERVDFVQAVLTALGGGLNFDSVRYTIFLSSPHLEETLSLTNGDPYIVEDPRLQKSLKAQMRNEMNPRIRKVTFEYDTCQKDIIKAQVDLRYPLSDPSKFYAKFTLTDFSVIKDEFIHEEELNFDSQAERLKDEEGNYTNNYSFRIQLEEKLNEKSAHNMYVELVNQDNYRVSRELKIFNKKIISILSEIKERFKDTGDGIKDKALRAKDEIKDKASRIKDKVSNIQ